MALSGNICMFTRDEPNWWTTENFKAYPKPEKALVAFQCVFTPEALKEIHQRCGATVPFDPEKMNTYVVVFCDTSKKDNLEARRIDLYAYLDNEQKAFTLPPAEARSILSAYERDYGRRAIDIVMSEEDRCGDKVKEFSDGVRFEGDMAAALADIAATRSASWKRNTGMEK